MIIVDKLSSFIAETSVELIPKKAFQYANYALIDNVGVTIAGSTEPVSKQIIKVLKQNKSCAESVIVASNLKMGVLDAAMVNSTMGHALDYDDSNFILGGHPSVVLYPAILSIGQRLGSSGKEILEAYIIGFEAMINLAKCINFEHYEKGWHPTATLGTFGAMAASARLLGLSKNQTKMAIGLAASMASGIKENFGTMAKPVQVGFATQKGLLSSLMAQEGISASMNSLEGKQGFLNVYNGLAKYETKNIKYLGEKWELIESGLMFKKYPCCGSNHSAIDAAIDLVTNERIDFNEINNINIRINPRRLPHVNRSIVKSALEAKFSVQYNVAAAIIDKDVSLRHFTNEAVNRREIQKLILKIDTKALQNNNDDPLSQACEILITLNNGGHSYKRIESAYGRHSEDFVPYLNKKFADCASSVYKSETIDGLMSNLKSFSNIKNINTFINRFLVQS